jgi:hypothetical protein
MNKAMNRMLVATAFAGVVLAGICGNSQAAPIAPLTAVGSADALPATPVQWDGSGDFGGQVDLGALLSQFGGERGLDSFGGRRRHVDLGRGRGLGRHGLAGRGFGSRRLAGRGSEAHGYGSLDVGRFAAFGLGGSLGSFGGGQGGFDVGELLNMAKEMGF